MKNIRKISLLLIIIYIVLGTLTYAFATDYKVSEFSEEYLKWLEIPDEEKDNYILPRVFKENPELRYPESNEISTYSEKYNSTAIHVLSDNELPSRFLRNDYGEPKDQGVTESCWAYSAATVFDTNYYKTHGNRILFANSHMDYITSKNYNDKGFNRNYNSGGNVYVALAYATNGMGIALESNMAEIAGNISKDTIKRVPSNYKVNQYIELKNRNEAKKYLYQYGVISSLTYVATPQNTYFSSSTLMNNNNLAYFCNNSDVSPNHAVTIVGWDDNYTNSAFPGKKGAYIVLNSWGKVFGNNGLYYVYYDDPFIELSLKGVTNIDNKDYNHLYQYDEYGYADCYVNMTGGAYAANVFSKSSSSREELTEISFYTYSAGNIEIYVNPNGSNCSISVATCVKKLTIDTPGYYTITLDEPIRVLSDKFTVIIKYPDNGAIPIEVPIGSNIWFSTASSERNQSFISANGATYEDLYDALKEQNINRANACIKAFTKNIEEQFTVTYKAEDGSTIGTEIVNSGEHAEGITAPSKTGYTFDGWYLGNTKFNFSTTKITRDITLVAKYTTLNYNVAFKYEDNTVITNQTVPYKGKATRPTTDPTKEGYVFDDWYLGDTKFDFNTEITGNITLIAKFVSGNHTVTFKDDNNQTLYTQTVRHNSKANKPVDPTKTGYKFKEWQLNNKKFDFNTPITENITLIAIFEDDTGTDPDPATSYDVDFVDYDGTFIKKVAVEKDKKVAKPADPTRSGYVFIGWYLDEKEFDFNTAITKNITLVAKYAKSQYTVTFKHEDGNIISTQKVNYNTKVNKPANPTKTGYVFKAWFLGEEAFDFNTLIKEDIVLVAKFDKNPSEIEDIDIKDYLFDHIYYAYMNDDLRNIYGFDKEKLSNHYYTYGVYEGRIASPIFDAKYYLTSNLDVKMVFGENNYAAAYNHFLKEGVREGRRSSKIYDVKYYSGVDYTVKELYKGNYTYAIMQFAKAGIKAGKKASSDFYIYDVYKKCSAYAKKYLGEDFYKYFAYSQGANLVPIVPVNIDNALFDAEIYYNLYEDLRNAFGFNVEALRNHFYAYGLREGRIASYVFDAKYYLEQNPDVAKVFGEKSYDGALYHFKTFGINEGRSGSIIFDAKYYIDQNKDIRDAFDTNYSRALMHFIQNGITENRKTSTKFDLATYKSSNNDLSRAYGKNYKLYYWHYTILGKFENRKII